MKKLINSAWGLHLLCILWIALVLTIAGYRHADEAQLWAAWREGDVDTQLQALNALSQRASNESLVARFPRELLSSDSARLRELAFTNLFTRRPETRVNPQLLKSIMDPAERERAKLWLHKQMTTPARINLQDLERWFLELPER